MKLAKTLCALGLVAMTLGGAFGCAVSAMTTTADGTVYAARSDGLLMGALRKMYACKPAGTSMNCTEVEGP